MGLFDNLFKQPERPAPDVYVPASEHEAWISLLLGVINADGDVSEIETDLLMRQLVFIKFFQGIQIIYHYKRSFTAIHKYGSEALIRESVKYIDEDFKPMIFTLAVESIYVDGDVTDKEKQIIDFAAKCLGITDELAEKIITVFNIRYSDNCKVVNDPIDDDDD